MWSLWMANMWCLRHLKYLKIQESLWHLFLLPVATKLYHWELWYQQWRPTPSFHCFPLIQNGSSPEQSLPLQTGRGAEQPRPTDQSPREKPNISTCAQFCASFLWAKKNKSQTRAGYSRRPQVDNRPGAPALQPLSTSPGLPSKSKGAYSCDRDASAAIPVCLRSSSDKSNFNLRSWTNTSMLCSTTAHVCVSVKTSINYVYLYIDMHKLINILLVTVNGHILYDI